MTCKFNFSRGARSGEVCGRHSCNTHQNKNLYHNPEMEVERLYFDQIKSGAKAVEGRKRTAKWASLRMGDEFLLKCKDSEEQLKVRIVGINEYADLKAYLMGEDLNRALPGITSLEEGIAIYKQWWTDTEIATHGILGLQLLVV